MLEELREIPPTDRRVELHVRADAAGTPRVADVRDRLTDLEGEREVTTWPRRVHLADDRPGVEFVEAYERFQSWATDAGADINPPFVVREDTRTVVGEEYAVLRAPTCCLAVADASGLVGVFPCVADGEYTVGDALDALEAADATENDRRALLA